MRKVFDLGGTWKAASCLFRFSNRKLFVAIACPLKPITMNAKYVDIFDFTVGDIDLKICIPSTPKFVKLSFSNIYLRDTPSVS